MLCYYRLDLSLAQYTPACFLQLSILNGRSHAICIVSHSAWAGEGGARISVYIQMLIAGNGG